MIIDFFRVHIKNIDDRKEYCKFKSRGSHFSTKKRVMLFLFSHRGGGTVTR